MTENGGAAKVPLSFWIVAGISLIWNAFGGYDYLMSKLRNMDYLSAAAGSETAANEMLAALDAMPVWAHALWGLGVWSSVAGSLLLLLRSKHAVTAFLVSLVTAAASFAYQATLTLPASMDTTAAKVMPLVILVAIAFFWQFSRREAAKGTLR